MFRHPASSGSPKFRFAQLPTVSRDEHSFCFARYIASAQNLLHGNMEERKGYPSGCKSTPLSRMKMVNTQNTCILQAARSKCSRYGVVLAPSSTELHKDTGTCTVFKLCRSDANSGVKEQTFNWVRLRS